jgi:glycosyltransferase involved in cell wall biosynthesis
MPRSWISLCIPTYNRSESLKETLNSVRGLRGVEVLAELLVIDNNSTDATGNVTETFAADLPIRRLVEKAQGASRARNRAIEEFKGDVLLFTDDDVRLDPNWLSAYALAIDQFPEAQFYGGRILPQWNGARPRWLKDERLPLLDGALVWYDYGLDTRPYLPKEALPFSASLGIRRSLVKALPGFRADLGPTGIVRGRGEDTEFLERAMAAGARGVYVGEALCWHTVDPRRLSVPALYRYGIESGRAHALMSRTNQQRSLYRVSLHIARGLAQLLKGRGDRFRQCVINAGIEVGMSHTTSKAS